MPDCYIDVSGSLTLAVVLTVVSPVMAATLAQEAGEQALRSELENIRALPYGYSAICEWPDLKIRSSRSATFVIRQSKLCALAAQRHNLARFTPFWLCSNDPKHLANVDPDSNPSESRRHVIVPPKCVDIDDELRLSSEGIEI